MTYPNPEEQERDAPASRGRAKYNGGDNLSDTHIAFDRIVAGLRAGPEQLRWPALDPTDNPTGETADDPGEDHFDPPEPPPLPIPRPRTVGGVLTLAIGVLLLAGPDLLNLGERVAMPLGLLALTAGIGWLVIGLRPDPPPSRPDDGAQL